MLTAQPAENGINFDSNQLVEALCVRATLARELYGLELDQLSPALAVEAGDRFSQQFPELAAHLTEMIQGGSPEDLAIMAEARASVLEERNEIEVTKDDSPPVAPNGWRARMAARKAERERRANRRR